MASFIAGGPDGPLGTSMPGAETIHPIKLPLIAAMRKLLHAVYSVARNRKPFTIQTEQARAA